MYEKSDGRVKGSSLYYFGGGLNGFAGLENGFELLGGDAVEDAQVVGFPDLIQVGRI